MTLDFDGAESLLAECPGSSPEQEFDRQWAGTVLDLTIQRMEASEGYVRGVIDTLTKVVSALELAGIELISENSISTGGGRGVRLSDSTLPLTRTPSAASGAKRKRSELPA